MESGARPGPDPGRAGSPFALSLRTSSDHHQQTHSEPPSYGEAHAQPDQRYGEPSKERNDRYSHKVRGQCERYVPSGMAGW